MKSGSLNLVEPSGPIQAYRGMALPLPCNKDGNVHKFVVEKQYNTSIILKIK
jgi:hypothetical protein